MSGYEELDYEWSIDDINLTLFEGGNIGSASLASEEEFDSHQETGKIADNSDRKTQLMPERSDKKAMGWPDPPEGPEHTGISKNPRVGTNHGGARAEQCFLLDVSVTGHDPRRAHPFYGVQQLTMKKITWAMYGEVKPKIQIHKRGRNSSQKRGWQKKKQKKEVVSAQKEQK